MASFADDLEARERMAAIIEEQRRQEAEQRQREAEQRRQDAERRGREDGNELSQAIPPAYTQFIGEQLLAHLAAAVV